MKNSNHSIVLTLLQFSLLTQIALLLPAASKPIDATEQSAQPEVHTTVRWYSTFNKGVAASRKSNKWLMVVVGGDWCSDTRRFYARIVPDTNVQNFLAAECICVSLQDESSAGKDMMSKHGVKHIPTVFIFTSKGEYIANANAEHVTPESFIALVSDITKQYRHGK